MSFDNYHGDTVDTIDTSVEMPVDEEETIPTTEVPALHAAPAKPNADARWEEWRRSIRRPVVQRRVRTL